MNKKLNKGALLLSLLILVLICAALQMTSVPGESRFTWTGVNPWEGVKGIAFTVQYFLRTGQTATFFITTALLLLIWWRLYALLSKLFRH